MTHDHCMRLRLTIKKIDNCHLILPFYITLSEGVFVIGSQTLSHTAQSTTTIRNWTKAFMIWESTAVRAKRHIDSASSVVEAQHASNNIRALFCMYSKKKIIKFPNNQFSWFGGVLAVMLWFTNSRVLCWVYTWVGWCECVRDQLHLAKHVMGTILTLNFMLCWSCSRI